ncbi:hypothetical protein [Saccharopolyspora sp. ASAGF58]|uniref:hypothetical protein n=1 Tax=Saccharopolyspora sp. ASAGF58 TaxID=2719023 RepID=UPI00143FEB80|nr:hypothetical protein [Saccharopolyspora sp. ASAGF58]QIZ38184.1 hypothetical protein FDZ84_30980 [Saccharopolyspora sp. ASAGF58]
MPAEHPDQLRRWWWKSPLAARLLPAAALLTATGVGVINALPTGNQDLATPPQPPRVPVSHLTPVTTSMAPPTTTTTTEPEPTTPPSTTTTTSKPPTTSATPTTTQQPQPTRLPNPPGHNGDNGRPRPTTTSKDDPGPVVDEGERCSQEGDFGRTTSGAAASCERADDGKLRWTTQW